MASKSRSDIELAVGQLLDIANNDPRNVPVLMALAHGFLLLKQTAKARNQLKVNGDLNGRNTQHTRRFLHASTDWSVVPLLVCIN
jgi:hypothetical protein